MQYHLLIVEDDRDLAGNLIDFLELMGYAVDYASDGVSAINLVAENAYDLLILDMGLPGMNGLAVCRHIRQEHKNNVPVIFLTARDEVDHKITAFDIGADDYVVKPASLKEIEARVKALIRRTGQTRNTEALKVGDLVLETGSMRIQRAGTPIALAPVPTRILLMLMRASPNVVSQEAISKEIWGSDFAAESHALTVHMHALRAAVDKPFRTHLIHTVRGFGYRISDDDPRL